MKTFLAVLMVIVALGYFIAIDAGCAEGEAYQFSDCAGEIQVVSDCADPNAVACICMGHGGVLVQVEGALDGIVSCSTNCAPYQE